jgi:hypothetical protein
VTPAELLALLQDFYRESLDLFDKRQKISQSVAAYDANNGYQQVIGRQEEHLRWVADAVTSLGGSAGDTSGERGVAEAQGEPAKSLIDADARSQEQFLDRWAPRVQSVTNARHRKMLELVLGEMKEHLRMLQQAADGRSDVLGRHADGKVLRGAVLPTRPKN